MIVGAKGVISPQSNLKHAKPKEIRGLTTLEPARAVLSMLEEGGTLKESDVRRLFDDIDANKNGRVTHNELTSWVVKDKVFSNLGKEDMKLTADRMFKDIDTDRNGSLDFDEFWQYIRLIRNEQRVLKHASKHHLTALPASVRVSNNAKYSLKYIETELCKKIDALVSRDSDRYRQILTLFKHQVQRSAGNPNEQSLCMQARDFNTFLSMLGLFATREQADKLFRKYDVNKDGFLTVHEFLTKAKLPDYPGLNLREEGYDFREGRGKKMFSDTAQFGVPVKPLTPAPSICDQGADAMYTRIRERLEQTARTGRAFSDCMARRKLFRAFEQLDKEHTGYVTPNNFRNALETGIGVILTGQHLRVLLGKYANEEGNVNYPQMVVEVYPNNSVPSTSLIGERRRPGQPPSRNSRSQKGGGLPVPKLNNQVNVTGSYWQPPQFRGLPALPVPASRTQQQRQGTMSRQTRTGGIPAVVSPANKSK